jgi:hypothetical protein
VYFSCLIRRQERSYSERAIDVADLRATEYMLASTPMPIDLQAISYEDWIEFIFDHHAPYSLDEEEERPKAWYWEDPPDPTIDPVRQVHYLTRLCREASPLLRVYTPEQIDQGLWYIFSAGGADEFYEQIFNPVVPWKDRAACIATLPELWPGLFEREDVGTMSYMLWDSVAYGFDCGNLTPGDDPDHHRIQEAMLAALTFQLESEASITQYAALHGLGHLCHPDSAVRIAAFLETRTMTPEIRTYAEKVLTGQFM